MTEVDRNCVGGAPGSKTTAIDFFDIVALFVLSTSILALALLVAGYFRPTVALLSSLLATAIILVFLARRGNYQLKFQLSRSIIPIILLLGLAAIFRYEPYMWIAGGQDQGTYVNMSKHFQDHGKVVIIDELRESLPEEYKSLYDAVNYTVDIKPWARVEGEHEGGYLPGVYLKDQEKSESIFQFYHLHPLWMAMFSHVLGEDRHSYSVVFFSLISILAFYFLAFELTGNRAAAWLAGGLLAVSPLHAFFSKFPVTEMLALTFSSLSFYYLAKYYNNAKRHDYCPLYLVMSALAIASLFFTRISGFMYIPWFYLLLIVVELYSSGSVLRVQLRTYVFSVFFLYGISVLYGLTFSYPYVSAIYRASFSKVLGSNWEQKLSLLVLALAIGYWLIVYVGLKRCSADKLRNLAALRQYIPHVLLLFLLLGGYKVYQLGFTDRYINTSLDIRWGIAGNGVNALLYWSPVVLVEYLSPFIAILFIYVMLASRKTISGERTMLLLFVLFFFAYICVLKWYIPYQYYYARYLLSEAFPYILLFSVTGIVTLSSYRKTAYILVACSAVYMLILSATQFRGKDMDGFKQSLDRLATYVEADDILIVNQRWLWGPSWSEIKTPLKFYYNYNVLSTDMNTVEQFISYYCGPSASHVLYLSAGAQPGLGLPIARLEINADIFEHKPYIPTHVVADSREYQLFRINCARWNRSRAGAQPIPRAGY